MTTLLVSVSEGANLPLRKLATAGFLAKSDIQILEHASSLTSSESNGPSNISYYKCVHRATCQRMLDELYCDHTFRKNTDSDGNHNAGPILTVEQALELSEISSESEISGNGSSSILSEQNQNSRLNFLKKSISKLQSCYDCAYDICRLLCIEKGSLPKYGRHCINDAEDPNRNRGLKTALTVCKIVEGSAAMGLFGWWMHNCGVCRRRVRDGRNVNIGGGNGNFLANGQNNNS